MTSEHHDKPAARPQELAEGRWLWRRLYVYAASLALWLLLRLAVSPVAAAGICYVLGVAASYFLNRRWTFASTDTHLRDMAKFLCAYGLGLASTMLTISLLLRILPPASAQLLNIAITAVVIYGCLRMLRFGSERPEHAH